MGEKENEPFQFTFNGFLKVAFQGSRVTSDAGLILVRHEHHGARLAKKGHNGGELSEKCLGAVVFQAVLSARGPS